MRRIHKLASNGRSRLFSRFCLIVLLALLNISTFGGQRNLVLAEDEEYDEENAWEEGDEEVNDDDLHDDEEFEETEETSHLTTTSIFESRVDVLRKKLEINFTEQMDLGNPDPAVAAGQVIESITDSLRTRLTKMFQKAKTADCRTKIGKHMGYFINAIGKEESLPFTDVTFPNECGEPVYDFKNLPENMHIGHIQNRSYQPPRNESIYIDDPDDMVICYGILTHDNPNATIRLIESLDEDGLKHRHQFVVHVDGKEVYDSTQLAMLEYASSRDNVHVLGDRYRVRVNWGGFSMVNATLQLLRYIFDVEKEEENRQPIQFHKFVHLSSSTYPVASNPEIRHRLADHPLDANFFHIIMQPTRASPYVWHYFVECDDAIHRIYQLPVLKDTVHGANTFTSSQWFIASYEFAKYLAETPRGSFVDQFLQYSEHVVVADESFFGTVLRHTKFCHKHHNRNFLHLQFDRWESELPASKRDDRKCPMPNPDHCGRSPTIMTVDYADIMELSDNLFARKFDDTVDTKVKEIVDDWRESRAISIKQGTDPLQAHKMKDFEFEGHGVLIVAKDTVNDKEPLCLGLGDSGNRVKLVPCFEQWVPQTLAEEWETGAVILRETLAHTRWEVGPCTSDGELRRLPSGAINVTLGNYSTTGPRCMIKQLDGIRSGRCYDAGPQGLQPGGIVQVYPCVREWYQFLSFGDGRLAPTGSLYSTIPSHIVKQIQNLGYKQIPYMCLGVYGRGKEDEFDSENKKIEQKTARNETKHSDPITAWEHLSNWTGGNISSTQCSNTGAVIEWVFVPFIVEEENVAQKETVEDSIDEL